MGRDENIMNFEDTLKRMRTMPELISAVKKSNAMQEVILETDDVAMPPPRFEMPARIFVSPKRSFAAAQAYLPVKTCVLNFASATTPGGGVARGSTAQEESLCRCSTLYANLMDRKLWKSFYEAHRELHDQRYNDDCIYTPDVIVFKSDAREPELLTPEDWWTVNIISCAAPNLRPARDGRIAVRMTDKELFALHVKRMCRILSIAASKGNDIVILGAYGCGAFQNPPDIVASALRQAAWEYRYCFKVIEFAVYCSSKDEQNYRAFHQIIGDQQLR